MKSVRFERNDDLTQFNFTLHSPCCIHLVAFTLLHSPCCCCSGENKIGEISSGTFSPSLKKPLAMGYVDSSFAKAGTKVTVDIRGKKKPAEITKMPFVECNYYRG